MPTQTLIRCFDADTRPYAAISGPDRTPDDFGGTVPAPGDVWADKQLGADRNVLTVIARYFDPTSWDSRDNDDSARLVRLLVQRRDARPEEIDILGF